MRGIIAEINGKYAIILAQDGSFKKIRVLSHMAVGSEIDLDQPSENIKVTRLISKVSAIAAGALFILGIGYGAYSYTVPYSYVDVDINPSIELTVNIYDRIIKMEALNDDGKKILENRNLKNTSLQSGVVQILSIALEQGYLKAGAKTEGSSEIGVSGNDTVNEANAGSNAKEPIIENAVLLTVASNSGNKSEVLAKKLAEMASQKLEKDSVNSEVLVGEASVTQRNDARIFGVTPGKLVLIEDALESEPELKLEDLKKASVKDLIKKAKDKKTEMEKLMAEMKKLEEEKQKAEELKTANDNKGDKVSKDNNKSETKINNGGSTDPMEPGPGEQEEVAFQERLAEQLEILKKISEPNHQNNGTDTKDGNDGKNNETDKKQGSVNQAGNKDAAVSSSQNSSVNSSSKNNINKNGNNNKGNYSRQDIAEILEKQKQEMQQLKEELLKQLLDADISGKNGQSENNPKTVEDKQNKKDTENKKNNKSGNSGGKK